MNSHEMLADALTENEKLREMIAEKDREIARLEEVQRKTWEEPPMFEVG